MKKQPTLINYRLVSSALRVGIETLKEEMESHEDEHIVSKINRTTKIDELRDLYNITTDQGDFQEVVLIRWIEISKTIAEVSEAYFMANKAPNVRTVAIIRTQEILNELGLGN